MLAQEGALELMASFISDASASDRDLRRSRNAARLLCTNQVLQPLVEQCHPLLGTSVAHHGLSSQEQLILFTPWIVS